MFSTKNLVNSHNDVPSYWVFQYYLSLPEVLTGQAVKIKSIFNPNERTPSMCIYVDNSRNEYMFKDFSTGTYGSKIDLVKTIFSMDYSLAVSKMLDDYNSYVKKNGSVDITINPAAKWEIDNIKQDPGILMMQTIGYSLGLVLAYLINIMSSPLSIIIWSGLTMVR